MHYFGVFFLFQSPFPVRHCVPGCQPHLGTPRLVTALSPGCPIGRVSGSSRWPNPLHAPLPGDEGDFFPPPPPLPHVSLGPRGTCATLGRSVGAAHHQWAPPGHPQLRLWFGLCRLSWCFVCLFFFLVFHIDGHLEPNPIVWRMPVLPVLEWGHARGHLGAGVREGAKGTPHLAGEQDGGSRVKAWIWPHGDSGVEMVPQKRAWGMPPPCSSAQCRLWGTRVWM